MQNQPAPVRIFLGVITTLVIMTLAVAPPILHFFTGPVGPGIGGFISGRRFKLSDREALIMGVIVALLAGAPAFYLLDGIVSGSTALIAAAVASLWSGGLATVAAWFAGSDETREARETSPEV